MTIPFDKTEILPNDNPKEREDKYGRVHVSNRRTWVLTKDGQVVNEYATKREAKRAAESLLETLPSTT